MKNKIKLTDNLMQATIKLVDGNPGALTALMRLMETSGQIDPDSAFAEFSPLLALDNMGIYGPNIWILYKDICGCDPVKVYTLMRARQLGIIPENLVVSASREGTHSFKFDELLAEVRAELPNFAKSEIVE